MTDTLPFQLSEDQLSLAEMVTEFAAKKLAPNALAWDRDKHFPVDVIRQAAGLGLGGICVAEDAGGSGLTRLDSTVVFEGLASGCPVIAAYLSIHNMVAGMIDRFGDEQQRQQYLPRLCSMDAFGSYCLTEPETGSDAGALRATAIQDGDSYQLNGVKQFVSGAGSSDVYVVMARTAATGPSGISAFIVDRDTPGLRFGPNEIKMGWNAQPTRQVILEQVRVPLTARLGAAGQGFKIAMTALDSGRINIGACSLGGAQAALDRTLTYLGDRSAFGRRLAEMDTLRARIADMATNLEAARLMVRRAAAALDAKSAEATRWCAMAKRFATDAGFAVANEALQLHGGYGYLSEYGIEKLVRDLRVHQILEGTNEIMRVIIARDLIPAAR